MKWFRLPEDAGHYMFVAPWTTRHEQRDSILHWGNLLCYVIGRRKDIGSCP